MKFSREFLDQLKSNVNLLDLISDYTELHKAGPYMYMGHCPHPKHNDSDASFRLNTKTNTWCCYGCHSDKKNKEQGNYGSDCIAFMEWVTDGQMSWIDAVKFLADRINLPLPVEKHEKQYNINYKLMKKYENELTEDALDYLKYRDISKNEIDKWHIGYDRFEKRIVFPLIDNYQNVVGFNRRLLIKETKGITKKYVHSADSEIFKKSNYLYGMNDIDKSFDYIILTEGVFDVILARKYGLKNVICALGTALSENQIQQIAKHKKEIIIAYDSDEKGITTMKKVIPMLQEQGLTTKLIPLPEGKDLADMSMSLKHGIKDYVLTKSMPYSYYLMKDLIEDFNQEYFCIYMKYMSMFKNIIDQAPESEKEIATSYINNTVSGKELNIEHVMRQMSQSNNM